MKRTCQLQLDDSLAGIRFGNVTEDDRNSFKTLCEALAESRKGHETDRIANDLYGAFSSQNYIHIGLIRVLSKYCETAASWAASVEPAQQISIWLTGGFVVPRLLLLDDGNEKLLPEPDYTEACQKIIRFVGRSLSDEIDSVSSELDDAGYFNPADAADERERKLREIVQRRGQPKFRADLIEAYGGKCAVTGCDVVQALEAAHISPYQGEQSNHVSNGLLLRADIHTLLDLHLIAVEPNTLKVRIAETLNGTCFMELQDRPLALPEGDTVRPSTKALEFLWKQF